jgi:hypothetical protein
LQSTADSFSRNGEQYGATSSKLSLPYHEIEGELANGDP